MKHLSLFRIAALAAALLALSVESLAHCDTMNGPVVKAGRQALEHKDLRYALVWVKPSGEAELRSAFEAALSVRELGAGARDLADRYFFETLVRVHRAGEGAPYTGLKDNDAQPEPGIASAERALEANSIRDLTMDLNAAVGHGLENAFHGVQQARSYDPKNVEAGRQYVARYVHYIHYVEGMYKAIGSTGENHGGEEHQH